MDEDEAADFLRDEWLNYCERCRKDVLPALVNYGRDNHEDFWVRECPDCGEPLE